jgi:hypothetical protein
MDQLQSDIKNYLNITYDDEKTNLKIAGIINNGIHYMDNTAGSLQDYALPGLARQLLFDYCRYVFNDAFEHFQTNFRFELINLRIGVQVDEYTKIQSCI